MTAKKRKKYDQVADVLPEVTRHQGWDVKLDMHSFFPKWKKVVGEDIASCSKPLKITKDTLWLEVESSTWMQQLQFEKLRILEAINATLKLSKIRDIRFVLPHASGEQAEECGPGLSYVPPDPKELEKFEQQVGIIEDEASREALLRLWYLAKSCRPDKR
jgi:hypothetical protein